MRTLLLPLLPPPPATFVTRLACGARLALEFRETLGLSYLLNGEFEQAEIEFLRSKAKPGSCAVDVGANVGLFTLALASAVHPGMVLAFEPVPANAERLKANLSMNQSKNVEVYQTALGDRDGVGSIFVTDDAAYTSMQQSAVARRSHSSIRVPIAKLDRVWQEAGRPEVSVMKIDVEGSELSVLKGATEVLERCRPVVMIEANTAADLTALIGWFAARGYFHWQQPHFMKWNHVFSGVAPLH